MMKVIPKTHRAYSDLISWLWDDEGYSKNTPCVQWFDIL